MGMIITDGAGGGHSAAVDSDNKLETHATMHSEEHYVSTFKRQAYFANTADTANTLTLATGNTYNMLFIQNNSAVKWLVIQKVFVSVDTAAVVLVVRKNMTVGAITNENTHIPPNANFSSGNDADALLYNWDEVGTAGVTGLTAGTIVNTYILAAEIRPLPFDGFMVLGQNDNVVFQIVNGTGGNVEAAIGCRFYFNDSPQS